MANIHFKVEHQIGYLTFARPKALNAISLDMLLAIEAAIDHVEQQLDVRALIIAAEGPHFCAGGDVKEWAAMTADEFAFQWIPTGNRVFDRLANLRCPTLGVINGLCFGGGLELAGCFDYRIASPSIRIALPESQLGVVPGWSGTRRLVQRFGGQCIRRMALFGEELDASQALTEGVVDKVTDHLEMAQAAWLSHVLTQGPRASAIVKQLINASESAAPGQALDQLSALAAVAGGETHQGAAAFIAKTKAQFEPLKRSD